MLLWNSGSKYTLPCVKQITSALILVVMLVLFPPHPKLTRSQLQVNEVLTTSQLPK